jgi:hypothetical protein
MVKEQKMAETLGSLVDKLTIKSLREFHLAKMMQKKGQKFTRKELSLKLALLVKQKKDLSAEIERFIEAALTNDIVLRDEKLKLYNKREVMGKILSTNRLSRAIEQLAQKNIELWHLEDEARREDVDLTFIGDIKTKIDKVNQQRNDSMDLIDELFEQYIKRNKENKTCSKKTK